MPPWRAAFVEGAGGGLKPPGALTPKTHSLIFMGESEFRFVKNESGPGAPEAQIEVSILFPDKVRREAVHRRSGIAPYADAGPPRATGTPSRAFSLIFVSHFRGALHVQSALFPL